jgi:hypothetical protein
LAGGAFKSGAGVAGAAAAWGLAVASGFLASDEFENDLKDMGIPFMSRHSFTDTIDVMLYDQVYNGYLFIIYF